MMRIILLLPLLALATAGGGLAEAPAPLPTPIVVPTLLMREVRLLEDGMAKGDAIAFQRRAELMRAAEAPLRQMPVEAWSEPRNWRALLAYVLGGGEARVLRDVAAKGALKEVDQTLVKGVLALTGSDDAEMLKLLAHVKTDELDISLAGPLVLALAPRLPREDWRKAAAMLEDVVLRAPGTLMEESALRRLTLLYLAHGETRQATVTFARRVRRFPQSVFSDHARKAFAAEIAASTDDLAIWTIALAGTRAMAPDAAMKLYLDIAESGLRKGKLELARNAATEADKLSAKPGFDPRAHQRALLYRAAADAPTRHVGEALKAFGGLQRDQLSPPEQSLLLVAERVANALGTGSVDLEAAMPPAPSTTQAQLKRASDLLLATEPVVTKAPR